MQPNCLMPEIRLRNICNLCPNPHDT